jgi:hypothetical protein
MSISGIGGGGFEAYRAGEETTPPLGPHQQMEIKTLKNALQDILDFGPGQAWHFDDPALSNLIHMLDTIRDDSNMPQQYQDAAQHALAKIAQTAEYNGIFHYVTYNPDAMHSIFNMFPSV